MLSSASATHHGYSNSDTFFRHILERFVLVVESKIYVILVRGPYVDGAFSLAFDLCVSVLHRLIVEITCKGDAFPLVCLNILSILFLGSFRDIKVFI